MFMTASMTNDCLRSLISSGARLLGCVVSALDSLRILSFHKQQRTLRRKYKITGDTPVLSYGAELEALIEAKLAKQKSKARVAVTSGSTSSPKRVLFTKRRLRTLKLTFVSFFLRCCWSLSIKRTSVYVFSSLHEDESLTSFLLEETKLPWYFSTLQAPYRVQSHPAVRLLVSHYGAAAVRLWILTLSNPGVLYSTNPSTISTFFDELMNRWEMSSELVRDWHKNPKTFPKSVRRIAKRITSSGSHERCAKIAKAIGPLTLNEYAPNVDTYICWTGGYVQPFLQRLRVYLPADRYRLIPMYSMSTETIETVGYFLGSDLSFLPIGSGVLYEFIEAKDGNEARQLLEPGELEPGHYYSMVVSDPHGLRRYDTGDVFLCRHRVFDLPDLTFARRRNLAYSFTGEKLTGEQISAAFEAIRVEAELPDDLFLTCIPSEPSNDSIPHYKIVALSEQLNGSRDRFLGLQLEFDRLLAEFNCEYGTKRQSGRLGPVRLVTMEKAQFIKLTNSQSQSWEAQFKFLPLYVKTWEAMQSRLQVQHPH